MQIKMDTDAVRAMSSRLRQTADSMDTRLTSIKSAVESAGWQSQAREEFIMQLEMLRRSTSQSAEVMRLMARASDRKADQWETIANVFNGPFYYLEGIWNSVVSFFSGIDNSIWNVITSIKLPSLPAIVLPSISGAVIIGGISSIIPKWGEWNPPDWWPFGKGKDKYGGGGEGGSGGGSWGVEDEETGKSPSVGTQTPEVPPEPVAITPKPYPQPPTSPELRKVTGKESDYTCATYAAARRRDLGSTQCSNERFKDQAAANYICKFEEKAFQIENSGEDLSKVIGPGYALVWEPDHPKANDTYGHVAIIEEVYSDHVIISEASKVNGVYQIRERTISIDQLNNDLVWLIP
jgi:uncharacterized protein YukE